MSSNDFLRQTLAHYREQRQRILEQQLRPLDLMIRRIEVDLGEASEEPATFDLPPLSVPAITTDHNGERKLPGNGKRPEIRPGEFFTMTQGEAARAYLNRVGEPVSIEELVEVLNKGGCKVGGADPNKTLYIVLIRNTKDFCKVPPDGYIGLRSMFPNFKVAAAQKTPPKKKAKGKKGKAGAKGRAKAAKAGAKQAKGKGGAKAASPSPTEAESASPTPEPPAQKEKIPVKAIVREVLADGEFQDGESIVKRAQEKAATIKGFTVYGVLKNEKEFEKMGDKFRLIK
jgi:hypothetical protein